MDELRAAVAIDILLLVRVTTAVTCPCYENELLQFRAPHGPVNNFGTTSSTVIMLPMALVPKIQKMP